ncbi:MAG: tetratricopeptide repeat protein [Armatimonadetes bacterium]|nr:tetratricopeptide repeat protein [Armatimonadota bacterium]
MTYEERFDAGAAALREGQADAAVEHLRECVAENPRDQRAQLYLGVAYGLTGAEEDAERHLQAALQLDVGNPQAHFNLARLRHRQNRLEEAVAGYQEVLRLDPDHAKARQELQALGRLPADLIASRMVPETPVASVRFGGARDVMLRRIDIVSALRSVGVAMFIPSFLIAVGLIIGGIVSQTAEVGIAGAVVAVVGLIAPLVAVPLMSAIYNVLAGWLGPVGLDLDLDAEMASVNHVDGLSLARIVATLALVRVFLTVLLYGGIFAVIGGMGAFSGTRFPAAGAVALVVIVIALIVGSAVAVGITFVLTLLQAALYNLVAPGLGGVRAKVDGPLHQTEIKRLAAWSTSLSVYVAYLPGTLLTTGYMFLSASISPMGKYEYLAVYCLPVVMFVGMLLMVLFYNLAAKIFGGLQVTLEED